MGRKSGNPRREDRGDGEPDRNGDGVQRVDGASLEGRRPEERRVERKEGNLLLNVSVTTHLFLRVGRTETDRNT